MLITASWVDEVKQLLGLDGVSQIWSETPAWYFWLSEAPGPFEFHFESGADQGRDNSGAASGFFEVKFFPRPSEWAFSAFSPEERALVSSDLFDHTNTVRSEARERIHPHLFSIGTIGISFSQEDDVSALFTLEAPEISRWRTRRNLGVEPNPGVVPGKERGGEVVRNVPAWRLARVLFDSLVSLHAFSAGARPTRVIFARSPGFEVVEGENGVIALEETDDLSLNTLTVLFTGGTGAEAREMNLAMDRESAGSDCRVVVDWKSDCHIHARPPSDVSDHVSSLWWTIADVKRHSSLGSTCGCH
jgi:hypothetical protein